MSSWAKIAGGGSKGASAGVTVQEEKPKKSSSARSAGSGSAGSKAAEERKDERKDGSGSAGSKAAEERKDERKAERKEPKGEGQNPHRKPALTADELKFFQQNGYVVLHNAVPDEDCDEVVRDIYAFMGFKDGVQPKNLDELYRAPATAIGFMELYHSAAMWRNRTNPRVYNAFADLWESDKLWVSIDRCGLKLPSKGDFRHKGFIHWDANPADPIPFQLQGALALSDTDSTMGGFHCVPGMHRFLKSWMVEKKVEIKAKDIEKLYSGGFPIKVPDPERTLRGVKDVPVPMKKGDLVIWRGELAHGNGENKSTRPRLAQYITYTPATDSEGDRNERVEIWKRLLPGGQIPYPQLVQRGRIPKTAIQQRKAQAGAGQPFELSELGKLVLGAELWPAGTSVSDGPASESAAGAAAGAGGAGSAKSKS